MSSRTTPPVWAQPRCHHALKKQQVFEFTKQVRIVHLRTCYALCMPSALLVCAHVLGDAGLAHCASIAAVFTLFPPPVCGCATFGHILLPLFLLIITSPHTCLGALELLFLGRYLRTLTRCDPTFLTFITGLLIRHRHRRCSW